MKLTRLELLKPLEPSLSEVIISVSMQVNTSYIVKSFIHYIPCIEHALQLVNFAVNAVPYSLNYGRWSAKMFIKYRYM